MTPQTFSFLCSEKGTQYPLNSLNSHSLESSKSQWLAPTAACKEAVSHAIKFN